MSRLIALPLHPIELAVARLRRWPVESQQAARRNAMVACTVLAARRAEREDVAEFLVALAGTSHGASRTIAQA